MDGIIERKPMAVRAPQSELGEGPVWDERSARLLWVDIIHARIHCLHPESGEVETVAAPEWISTLIPSSQGRWIAAAYHSLFLWEPANGNFEEILRMEHFPEHVRFNDGKAGPDGGIWAGTMDMNGARADGGLYRIDPSLGWEEKLSGLVCSNGLDWSLDGSEMYGIDSAYRQVNAYAFDPLSGTLGERRTAVELATEFEGVPDGMCIDLEGMLWVAQWGGSRVARWNPADGSLLSAVRLPAPLSSSCAFGGRSCDALYMTSACEGMNGAQRSAYPLSGSLFRLDTDHLGIRGRQPFRFDLQ
ncbi:SMP-30/gluconolactonase/LRE family protein [Cohnella faecalis]|uniref:SMP-30/gluconolactonase/LRE family protein n=1 Tax=Cohnella faecalis TaxID=2315694 RepID=A0A398CER3_9BACL|nr:SMP-30/gluconolactonase/LRE family protein [Cohnella faecalis]RIE00352.1 SMP-30/gluconolactonase/LRE family protein [Cohnella faecalis]